MIKTLPVPLPSEKISNKKNGARLAADAAKRLSIFVFAAAMSGLLCFAINDGQFRFENFLYAQVSEPINEIVYATPKKTPKINLELNAKAGLSLSIAPSGKERIIFQKNIDDVLPIASLTKLMAATVIFENGEIYDREKQITVSEFAAGQVDVPVAGNLFPGQIYSMRQLLDLMLFYSSNDAAFSLAEVMGADQFTAAMNQKARDIGLMNTAFFNPTGLDIDGGQNNYSNVSDLLVLTKYILANHPEIFSITIQPGNYPTENGIFSFNLWDGQKLIGGKTGYTEKAGGCMIAIFENQTGRRFINILLGSLSPESRVAEMQKMINCDSNSEK